MEHQTRLVYFMRETQRLRRLVEELEVAINEGEGGDQLLTLIKLGKNWS